MCSHTFSICNALLPRARQSSWDLSGGVESFGYSYTRVLSAPTGTTLPFCLQTVQPYSPLNCVKFSNFAFAGRSVVTQRMIARRRSNLWLGPTGTLMPGQQINKGDGYLGIYGR